MCASSEIHLHDGCTSKVSGGLDRLGVEDLDESKREPTMSRLSPLPRSRSRASLAPSETTYHSFLDNEIQEPGTVPASSEVHAMKHLDISSESRAAKEAAEAPAPQPMRRQDSGYESLSPRQSYSSRHRTSSITTSTHRPRTRPSIRRSIKSGPVSHLPKAQGQSLFRRRPTSQSLHSQHQQLGAATGNFFHFPSFASNQPEAEETELVVDTRLARDLNSSRPYAAAAVYQAEQSPRSETPTFPLPPQTTHYWTSDRTRRLEYAAIDAAGKGVKGWVMRYMIPDCFVPKDRRRPRFEDDSGSVVRYRIDLEGEEKEPCMKRKRSKTWWL